MLQPYSGGTAVSLFLPGSLTPPPGGENQTERSNKQPKRPEKLGITKN